MDQILACPGSLEEIKGDREGADGAIFKESTRVDCHHVPFTQ